MKKIHYYPRTALCRRGEGGAFSKRSSSVALIKMCHQKHIENDVYMENPKPRNKKIAEVFLAFLARHF
jgi:hypothetical protein